MLTMFEFSTNVVSVVYSIIITSTQSFGANSLVFHLFKCEVSSV